MGDDTRRGKEPAKTGAHRLTGIGIVARGQDAVTKTYVAEIEKVHDLQKRLQDLGYAPLISQIGEAIKSADGDLTRIEECYELLSKVYQEIQDVADSQKQFYERREDRQFSHIERMHGPSQNNAESEWLGTFEDPLES